MYAKRWLGFAKKIVALNIFFHKCQDPLRQNPPKYFFFSYGSAEFAVRQANWAVSGDYQQCGILTSVDSGEPLQPNFKLRNFKWR